MHRDLRVFHQFVLFFRGDSSMFSRPQKGGDNETSPGPYNPSLASLLGKSNHADLRLDRLQPLDLESRCRLKRVFGRFVAREALLEEELWVRLSINIRLITELES